MTPSLSTDSMIEPKTDPRDGVKFDSQHLDSKCSSSTERAWSLPNRFVVAQVYEEARREALRAVITPPTNESQI